MKKPLDLRQVDEEDNLIELDISPTQLILGFLVDRDYYSLIQFQVDLYSGK